MSRIKLIMLFILMSKALMAQFQNHQWLIGYGNWANKGRIVFSDTSYSFAVEQRKMGFNGTQGNICNANGDFLMSSNGVWVANANNDSLMWGY